MSTSARLDGFSVKGYKAFAQETRVDLARLTLVLGRNHAGKSALCRAPLYFTYPLRENAWYPFPKRAKDLDIDFGRLLDVCYQRQPSGLRAALHIAEGERRFDLAISAAEDPERGAAIITELSLTDPAHPISLRGQFSWEEIRQHLEPLSQLSALPAQIRFLRGVRARPEREYEDYGDLPPGVGAAGEFTSAMLAYERGGEQPILEEVNAWMRQLHVRLGIEKRPGGRVTIQVHRDKAGGHQSASNLVDAGEGIGQVLPVATALLAQETLQQLGRPAPQLFIIEHPEEQLHPQAHSAVADLLIQAALRPGGPTLLVETHSPVLALRIRRRVAEQQLAPEQVRFYFVEQAGEGSRAWPIQMNDRGTMDARWPRGIFAEEQAEFHAIRQALAARDK